MCVCVYVCVRVGVCLFVCVKEILQFGKLRTFALRCVAVFCSEFQCVAVPRSLLQRVAD